MVLLQRRGVAYPPQIITGWLCLGTKLNLAHLNLDFEAQTSLPSVEERENTSLMTNFALMHVSMVKGRYFRGHKLKKNTF